jgi:hypothetical protein
MSTDLEIVHDGVGNSGAWGTIIEQNVFKECLMPFVSESVAFTCANRTAIFKSIILPLSETWSVTLREEHSLRVFKGEVLRKLAPREM